MVPADSVLAPDPIQAYLRWKPHAATCCGVISAWPRQTRGLEQEREQQPQGLEQEREKTFAMFRNIGDAREFANSLESAKGCCVEAVTLGKVRDAYARVTKKDHDWKAEVEKLSTLRSSMATTDAESKI